MATAIATKSGSDVEMDGFPTCHRNLVIHKGVYAPGSPAEHVGVWTVTHAPTGYAAMLFLPNKECAEQAARWLVAQGVDWDATDKADVQASATKQFGTARKALEQRALSVSGQVAELFDAFSE